VRALFKDRWGHSKSVGVLSIGRDSDKSDILVGRLLHGVAKGTIRVFGSASPSYSRGANGGKRGGGGITKVLSELQGDK